MGLSNDIVSQFVELTKTSDKIQNEASVYGTIVTDGSNTYVKLDGSEQLTPIETTTNVAGGERVIVRIKDHKATVTGNITSPSVNNGQLEDVKDQISEFEVVIAERVTANEAVIGKIEADNIIINKKLTAIEGDFETIKADNVTITEKLTVNEAEIKDLKVKKLDVESADLKFATIENLEATTIEVNTIKGNHAEFSETVTDKLEAIDADIKNLDTEKLNAKDADIKYANIDFANINMAAVEKLFTESGIIKNLVVGDTSITGELVGVTIKGDLIEANTLVADKLVVKGEDGLYYKLNTDGMRIEAEQTEYNSLNGSIITAKSITATKISVDDLVAFDATIGGFNISSNSIYSGVKSSVNNTTKGIYLDKDGQIAFGDANNFLKFFRDTDGKWKLNISANSLKFSTSDKTVEEVIEDIDTKVQKTVKTVVDYYASSSSSTTKPTTGWQTTPPEWVNGKFIWAKTKTTYTDGTSFESEPVCITGAKGDTGKPGVDGTSGVGISSVDIEYYLSTSSTTLTGGSWSTNSPTWVDGKYMWSRTKTTTTDGKSTTSEPVCITGGKGATGSNGSNGAVGQGVDSITEEYYLSTSKTTQSGGSWVTTPPTWSSGKYLWTRSKIIYKNPTETSYTTPVCDNSWEAVNEVEIGGRNLLLNSDFRRGITGPFAATSSGGGTISVSNNTSRNTNIISMRGIKYFSTSKYLKIDFGTLTAGTYTFSLDYYVYNSTTSYQLYFDYDVAYDETIIEKFTKEKWTRVSQTFTVAKDGKVVLSLYTTAGTNDLMDVDICYPKLEKGNKATDWTLAHEDIQSDIDNIKIGGRNLLINSGDLYLVGSDFPSSSKREKGKITVTAKGRFNSYAWVYNEDNEPTTYLSKSIKDLSIPTGQEVTFSIDIKTTGLTKSGVMVSIDYRTASSIIDSVKIDIEPNKNNQWIRYSGTIKSTRTDTINSLFSIHNVDDTSDLTGVVIEYRNCMIEEGNKASAYSKAPEDIDNKIDNLVIGGTNLLRNSDFSYKEKYKFWHDSTTGIVKEIYSDIQKGYNSFVKLTTNHTASAGLIYDGIFSMNVGEKLTLSLDINTDNAIKIGIAIDGGSLSNGKIFDITNTNKWITLKATFTYTGINPAVRVYCANADGVTRIWRFTHIKLERGEYATSWNKHPDDYIEEVNSLQDTMNGAFKDNILSESEKKAIKQSLNIIKGDAEEVQKQYDIIYNNVNLIGTPKTNLINSKTSYNSAYNSLVSFINNALSSSIITDSQVNSIQSAFGTYRTTLGTFQQRLQEAIDSINSKKVNDIQVGGRNLWPNSSFNQGLDSYSLTLSKGTITLDNEKFNGNNVVIFDRVGTTAGSGRCFITSKTPPTINSFKKGDQFILTAWVYIERQLDGLNSSNIMVRGTSGDNPQIYIPTTSDVVGKWIKLTSNVFTAGADGTFNNCYVLLGGNGRFKVSQIQLEKGNKSTDWTPAQEDIDSQITVITNKVTDAESSIEQLDTSIKNKVWQTDIDKTIVEVNNRGENLVTNGNASYKDNTNFKSFIYRGNIRGVSGYPSFEKGQSYQGVADEKIFVDTTKDYRFCYELRAVEETTNVAYGVMVCGDIDGKEISHRFCHWIKDTTTTLAKPLNPGDTVVYISNLTNWNVATASRYYQRGFIFWNYSDSTGYTYPAESYSRNVYTDLYSDDTKVNKTSKTITLSSPWKGPLIPVGTKLSQSDDGATYEYLGIVGSIPPKDFVRYDVAVPSSRFRSGTVYVKVGVMTSAKVYISNIHFGLDKVNSADLSLVTTEITNVKKRTATLETNVDGITSKVTKLETTTTTINGSIKDHETRIQTTEQKVTATGVITTIQDGINSGKNSLNTMQFILDKNGATIKNGALRILNKAGSEVLKGDAEGNLKLSGVFTTGTAERKSIVMDGARISIFDRWDPNNEERGWIVPSINEDNNVSLSLGHNEHSALGLRYTYGTQEYNMYSYMTFDYYNVYGRTNEKVDYSITVTEPIILQDKTMLCNIMRLDNYKYGSRIDFYDVELYGNKMMGAIGCGRTTNSYGNSYGDIHLLGKRGSNPNPNAYASIGQYSADSETSYYRTIVVSSSGVEIKGNLTVSGGTKNRLVETKNYGQIKLNAYETTDCYFGDIGQGKLDDNGVCYIALDPIFMETVNTNNDYQVFLQKYGSGDVWVSDRTKLYFVVKGTPNLKFAWEVKAKQLGYETTRLDQNRDEVIPEVSYSADIVDKDLEKVNDILRGGLILNE